MAPRHSAVRSSPKDPPNPDSVYLPACDNIIEHTPPSQMYLRNIAICTQLFAIHYHKIPLLSIRSISTSCQAMANRALFITKPQGSWVVQTRSIPTPSDNEILVRNAVVALNPVNYKVANIPGLADRMGFKTWPAVFGSDLAGTVQSVGSAVAHFKAGDRVAGFAKPPKGPDYGAFQEYALLTPADVTLVPDNVDLQDAATLPVSVLTAAGLLLDSGVALEEGAAKGLTVLVWGGASSVGTSTIQFAKALGATVFATASPQHHEYLRELGAEVVLDYKSGTLIDDLKKAEDTKGVKLTKFIDAVAANLPATAAVVSALGGGNLITVAPWQMVAAKHTPPENVKPVFSGQGSVGKPELGTLVMHGLVEKWLKTGVLRGHKVQIVPGGLEGIEAGLNTLQKGVSGVKLVLDL